MVEIVKVVKSQNVDFFTMKSQTLIDNIFKYGLNFEKNKYGFMLKRLILVKMHRIVKSQKFNFGQMTILPFDQS